MEDFSKFIKYEGLGNFSRDNRQKKQSKLYSFKIKPDFTSSFRYDLPEWLNEYVQNALYILPDNTLTTLKYLFQQADLQFNNTLYLGYDTAIRDELRDIGATMINKAVVLLTDYFYDQDLEYYVTWNSLINRHTLKKIILYQLWSGRTGRGMQQSRSSIKNSSNGYFSASALYQNDYWLKKILDNNESIIEKKLSKNIEFPTELTVIHGEDVVMGERLIYNRYDATFTYYRRPIIQNDSEDFLENIQNDIPEKTTRKYKIIHYDKGEALKYAFNTLMYDLFKNDFKYEMIPIHNFKFSIDVIKSNVRRIKKSILLLKKS